MLKFNGVKMIILNKFLKIKNIFAYSFCNALYFTLLMNIKTSKNTVPSPLLLDISFNKYSLFSSFSSKIKIQKFYREKILFYSNYSKSFSNFRFANRCVIARNEETRQSTRSNNKYAKVKMGFHSL
jgi:hypothetical protein